MDYFIARETPYFFGKTFFGYGPVVRPICPRRTSIFFIYRDSGYYMRTPSVQCSKDLLPMLRVLRNPKYSRYTGVYQLKSCDAKYILNKYANCTQAAMRDKMRDDVRKAAFARAYRDNFRTYDSIKRTLLVFFPSELFEDVDETIEHIDDTQAKGYFLRNNRTDHTG